ncbi:MAG: TIGR03619 family F420-dependent LLM class oxidoreductase [Thermoanaerobaculia bacterium]|nr:TIGR03619 family F420-dependent LLM class oxidoreductase [Thermoanaerobaculia bacterium]
MYRSGPEGVARLATAIEEIGFDQLDIFDHVVMGHPVEGREVGPYPAKMPIVEALTSLAFFAAVTRRVGLGTEVLVLPQRQPTLVAKQVATLDTLSGGRVRLGVGVGWQESEYDALGVPFAERGARMDEAIRLLRRCWGEDPVTSEGPYYPVASMAMEPKPPQGRALPIWVGGHAPVALRRAGTLGDGWMAVRAMADLDQARRDIETVRRHAEEAGRDPGALGFQCQVAPPPRSDSAEDREFYTRPKRVADAAARLRDTGFDGVAVNATSVFLAGHRSVEALIEALATLHEHLRAELG